MLLTLDLLAGTALLMLLGLAGLVARRRWLSRGGGTFDCSLRRTPSGRGLGWALGLARYRDDALEWYRVFSFAPRPRHVLRRGDLRVRQRRRPGGPEALAVQAGAVVLECLERGRPVELAMSDRAVTGFLSWLESAPPGRHLDAALS